jgi:hypothetical protein
MLSDDLSRSENREDRFALKNLAEHVEFRNQDTGIRRQTTTNGDGYYQVEGIDPGKYDATVQASGFKTLTRENIVFHVGDKGRIDFKMQIGESAQRVEVDGSGLTSTPLTLR